MVLPVKPVPDIFFERQVSRLCAQHALNMLLQGPYYTADYLAEVAKELDERELAVLSPEQRTHFQSQNVDETGFFSLQVIEMALQKCHQLSLINLDNPSLAQYKTQPSLGNAYICNLSEHWFTIRKFNTRWFILNSTNKGPKPVSHTYLDVYLAQLRNDGYSIFCVYGNLPNCQADQLTAEDLLFYSEPSSIPSNAHLITIGDESDHSDVEMARAIALSLAECDSNEKPLPNDWDNAGQQSLQQDWNDHFSGKHLLQTPSSENIQLQKALQASLREQIVQQGSAQLDEEQDQADLKMAIQLSLGGMASGVATTVNQDQRTGQQPCSSGSCSSRSLYQRHRGQSPLRSFSNQTTYYKSESSYSEQSRSTFSYNSTATEEQMMEVNSDELVERINNKAEAIDLLLNEWERQDKKN